MRATFGEKLLAMRPLTVSDYDRVPVPPVVELDFTTRLLTAGPALAGVLAAVLAAGLLLRRSARRSTQLHTST